MKEIFSAQKKDKIIILSFISSGFFTIVNLLYTLFFFRHLPPLLPLFNQLPWGEKRIGARIELFIPLGIVVLITLSNFLISGLLYQKAPLISRIVSITALLVSLFAFLFTVRTIGLVL